MAAFRPQTSSSMHTLRRPSLADIVLALVLSRSAPVAPSYFHSWSSPPDLLLIDWPFGHIARPQILNICFPEPHFLLLGLSQTRLLTTKARLSWTSLVPCRSFVPTSDNAYERDPALPTRCDPSQSCCCCIPCSDHSHHLASYLLFIVLGEYNRQPVGKSVDR